MNRNLIAILMTITGLILGFGCTGPAPKNSLSPEQQAEYLERGKNITMSSFKALSSELMKAIETGGLEKAVNYCNLKAIPLTDSLSGNYKAEIHRISDRYRNPDNRPGELDMKVISAYRLQMEKGQELQAHLEVTGDTVYYYSPILIQNPLCLQCHGEPGNTMDPSTEKIISLKYPEDMAKGYKLGELRGVWKIMFND